MGTFVFCHEQLELVETAAHTHTHTHQSAEDEIIPRPPANQSPVLSVATVQRHERLEENSAK